MLLTLIGVKRKLEGVTLYHFDIDNSPKGIIRLN